MTILFMTRKFPPSKGGMENFAHDLYEALTQEVNVKLIKWGGSNKYLLVLLPWFFIRASRELLRGNIDIIHAQDGIMSVVAYPLSRIFRKPFVVVIHGLDITHKTSIYQAVIPKFVRKAQVVFCISQAAADEAEKRGVATDRIRVIPIGMADKMHIEKKKAQQELHEMLQLEQQTPLLLTVGRLVKRKGVAWFIANVMPELVKSYPTMVYLVVGGGDEEYVIKSAIQSKRLEKNVRVMGVVSNEVLPVIYNGADVFVQPNIVVPGDMEGFGLVLLEASLCELPVVAANIEGIKDAIVQKENGILVEQKDSAAFGREIGKFIGSRERAHHFGADSRRYTLTHFQWDVIAKDYVGVYETVVHPKVPS